MGCVNIAQSDLHLTEAYGLNANTHAVFQVGRVGWQSCPSLSIVNHLRLRPGAGVGPAALLGSC